MKNELCFADFGALFRRRPDAVAVVCGGKKYPDIHGRVMFYQMCGGVVVRAEIAGLPKGSGTCCGKIFAFHIHSGNNCRSDGAEPFMNTGGHYNPKNCQHPYHAGDLLPLMEANGRAFSAFLTDRFTVREILGRTVIIHSSPDDFTTQPSGNAGEKIACGVICAAQ